MKSLKCFTRSRSTPTFLSRASGGRSIPALAAALLLLLLQSPVGAQTLPGPSVAVTISAPAGLFGYDLGPAQGAALWNFSGFYDLPFYTNLVFRHYGDGQLAAFWPGDTNLNFDGAVMLGTVVGPSSRPRLLLKSTAALPLSVYPIQFLKSDWRRKDFLRLAGAPESGELTGKDYVTRIWTQMTPTAGSGGGIFDFYFRPVMRKSTHAEAITLTVPTSTDGRWTLTLDLTSATNRITGAAFIQFTNGEVFEFKTAGTWFPRTETARLVLKGTGTAKGAYLNILFIGRELNIRWFRGRVGGESVHFP